MKITKNDIMLTIILLLAILSGSSCNSRTEQHQCACVGYGINGKDTARFIIQTDPGDDVATACRQSASSGTTSLTCFVEQ